MSVTVTLSSPIQAHGKSYTELTLREPTGKHIRLAGYPFTLSAAGGSLVDAPAMARMIAQLADIPDSSVDLLSLKDWSACMAAITGFFGGSAESVSA